MSGSRKVRRKGQKRSAQKRNTKMDVVKTITIEELNTKDMGWFKEQYYRIYNDTRKKQLAASAYASTYYRDNREKILKKRQEHQKKTRSDTPRRPRGRPRKYTTCQSASSSKTEENDYEIEVVVC